MILNIQNVGHGRIWWLKVVTKMFELNVPAGRRDRALPVNYKTFNITIKLIINRTTKFICIFILFLSIDDFSRYLLASI